MSPTCMYFGCRFKDIENARLTRENYAPLNETMCRKTFLRWTDESPYYSDDYCKKLQEDALFNFDLNMAYFKSLDQNKFNKEIEDFINSFPCFEQIHDLRPYKGVSGIYIMILDRYKQLYIGITERGIKERIQQHWLNVKRLDRLLWGDKYESVLSIDSFRRLDTTRILVWPIPKELFKKKMINEIEYGMVEDAFSPEFLCNRIAGGDIVETFDMKVRDLQTVYDDNNNTTTDKKG